MTWFKWLEPDTEYVEWGARLYAAAEAGDANQYYEIVNDPGFEARPIDVIRTLTLLISKR